MTITATRAASATTAGVPYLAAIPVDHPALTRRVQDWNDQEQIHKAVMSLFREDLPGDQHQRRAATNILYRPDLDLGRILVQAATPPQRTDYGIRVTALDGLLNQLTPDRPVRFRLAINAVHCQARTHKRIPVPDHELEPWLVDRLAPALTAVTIHDAAITIWKRGTIPLRVAHTTGTANINNIDALRELINHGVGRAKPYGCGLLQLLPT